MTRNGPANRRAVRHRGGNLVTVGKFTRGALREVWKHGDSIDILNDVLASAEREESAA
jgi:hypothetical protein